MLKEVIISEVKKIIITESTFKGLFNVELKENTPFGLLSVERAFNISEAGLDRVIESISKSNFSDTQI